MTGPRFGFTLLAALAIAAFVALGQWQWQRGQYKLERAAGYARAQAQAASEPLASLLAGGRIQTAALPRRVHAEGRWSGPTVLLDNVVVEGRAGLRAFRALALADDRVQVLVDLGWMPWGAGRTLPALQPLPDPVRVEGLLAPWPGQGIALGSGNEQVIDAQRSLWVRLDRDAIAERIGGAALIDAVLRLGPEAGFGYLRDLDPLAGTVPPERHRAYAVQWFGLAATVAVIYGVLMWRTRRR